MKVGGRLQPIHRDGFEELRKAFEQYWEEDQEEDREEDGFAHLCQAFRLFWDEDGQEASQSVLRGLMSMVGLDDVKAQFLKVKSSVEIAKRQGIDLSKETFDAEFAGNPGTGEFALQAGRNSEALVFFDYFSSLLEF